jgi:hypothetical protein
MKTTCIELQYFVIKSKKWFWVLRTCNEILDLSGIVSPKAPDTSVLRAQGKLFYIKKTEVVTLGLKRKVENKWKRNSEKSVCFASFRKISKRLAGGDKENEINKKN